MTMNRLLASTAAVITVSAGTTVDAVQAQMQPRLLVDAAWVEAHLDDDHVAVLHASMNSDRYREGHLPGARFLDLSKLVWNGEWEWGTEMTSLAEIDDALELVGISNDLHHIVVYSDNPLFASRAFMTLEVVGFRGRVQLLDGGLTAWVASGRELSTETPHVERGEVTLELTDDILVDADWIHERLDDPAIALIDARPDDEYTGDDGGMGGMTNPGHIPGAAQMYWEELIHSREDPTLLARNELEELFAHAGADEGDTVVAYCMVGWRASYTYFTARMLGYETKFYDGSWHDWGTRDDLPYVTGTDPG